MKTKLRVYAGMPASPAFHPFFLQFLKCQKIANHYTVIAISPFIFATSFNNEGFMKFIFPRHLTVYFVAGAKKYPRILLRPSSSIINI